MSGRFIGSSDLPAIVAWGNPDTCAHLANWSNVADLYARLVLNIGKPGTDAMSRGLQREPFMREQYRRDIGWVSDPVGMVRSRKFPWAAGSPDGFAEPSVVVEFKTSSHWQLRPRKGQPPAWGPSGTDLVPDKYAIQCNWLCGVTRRDVAHLLVEFGEDIAEDPAFPDFIVPKFDVTDCRVYELPFERELFEEYERLAQRFMDEHVTPKVPPQMDPVADNKRNWRVLTGFKPVKAQHPQEEANGKRSEGAINGTVAGAEVVGGNGAGAASP